MTNKVAHTKDTKKQVNVPHSGMMGDGTEEQNLGQSGNPEARIKRDEVKKAFHNDAPRK
jgi:hypothetical protein